MVDRVPKIPGRVKITYADGKSEFVTVEMADDPAEVGTPLNKATLLSDDAATAVGILNPNDRIPSVAFKMLSRAINAKASIVSGTYSGKESDYEITVNLGQTPSAVLVMSHQGFTAYYDYRDSGQAGSAKPRVYGGLATKLSGGYGISFIDGGFKISNPLGGRYLTQGTHRYLAFFF